MHDRLAYLLTQCASTESQDRAFWHILDTSGSEVALFLACWHHWTHQSARHCRLFYTAIAPSVAGVSEWLPGLAEDPTLGPYARQLARQWLGLLPGTHRLVFNDGLVQLTLHVGDGETVFANLDVPFDAVYAGADPTQPVRDLNTLADWKRIRGLFRDGTRVIWPHSPSLDADWSAESGWVFERVAENGLPHQWSLATFRPTWKVGRSWRKNTRQSPRHAVVVGAGLAGSAAAWSLAQRGWRVDVIDAAPAPAAGASGLPAGLFAPHVSPDDAPLSQLTRDGIRATRARAAQLLETGRDWAPSGVLEHRVEQNRALPTEYRKTGGHAWLDEWTSESDADRLLASHLPAGHTALWHGSGGWIKPAALVRAQLQHSAIRFRGGISVHSLESSALGWRLIDEHQQVCAQSPVVILACAYAVCRLLNEWGEPSIQLPLHALRGQVTWGYPSELNPKSIDHLPPWPVNGYGSFLSGIPDEAGRPFWIVGSTFERGVDAPIRTAADQSANLERLTRLLPAMARAFDPDSEEVRAWAGVRCTVPDRLPVTGALHPDRCPGLHVLTGLGARGLTLSILSGELLAAEIEGEPWPVHGRLVRKMRASRFVQSQTS